MSGKKFVLVFVALILLGLGVVFYVNQDSFLSGFKFEEERLLEDLEREISKYPSVLATNAFNETCMKYQNEVMTKSGVPDDLEPKIAEAFCLCTTEAVSKTPLFPDLTQQARRGDTYGEIVKANYKFFKSNTRHCSRPRHALW